MLLSHGLALKPHFHTRMVDNLDEMISETSDLPEDIREQGHQTILSLINNYAESDEVRMAAITVCPALARGAL